MTKVEGFAAHRKEQLRAWRALSYQQRLEWLWQAKQFAEQALTAAKARRAKK